MRMCRSLLRALTLCACASFDKTGTLTRSNLRLLGIAGAPEAELKPPDEAQLSEGATPQPSSPTDRPVHWEAHQPGGPAAPVAGAP